MYIYDHLRQKLSDGDNEEQYIETIREERAIRSDEEQMYRADMRRPCVA